MLECEKCNRVIDEQNMECWNCGEKYDKRSGKRIKRLVELDWGE